MATIKDIAKKTGVSVMTVSRAFNNPTVVKESVRNEILAVAKELGYVPNQAARSLASNKTGIIQIVTRMDPSDYYFTQLFTGAADTLSDHGYSIMINRHKALNYQYDGAIYMGLLPGDDKVLFEEMKKPFVIFGKSELPLDWVDIDNVNGTRQVTKYLIDQGHKKIGFLGIKEEESFIKERFDGYQQAMIEAGLPINKESIFYTDHSIEGVMAIRDQLLDHLKVTAYVCESDVLAYQLIKCAQEKGIKIPEDLSVVGFDGFMFNRLSKPHITTVVQPVYEVGRAIAHALMNRMENPKQPVNRQMIQTSLDVGESVKKL